MATVAFHTLGCKVNHYETEAIWQLFKAANYERVDFEAKSDVYVINTCTVTNTGDKKSRQVIRRAIRKNPDAVICVTGCYAQTSPAEILAIPGVDVVVGTQDHGVGPGLILAFPGILSDQEQVDQITARTADPTGGGAQGNGGEHGQNVLFFCVRHNYIFCLF